MFRVEKGITGYCVKCKKKRKMEDTQEITTKNGRRAVKGICPVCSCKMFKFLKMEK